MIGLLIITHETLGEAYTQLAGHFFGEVPPNVRILGVRGDDSPQTLVEGAEVLLAQLDCSGGTLMLTDIFGATPCNTAQKLIHDHNTLMVAGLNAPMMVKAIQYAAKSNNVHELAEAVKQAAINGIMIIDYNDVSHCDAETRS